ncbi:unnamed protein product [Zymoseptoria tritici ST99CH_3D1]|nr:unnamed protein product [Zymoseptoria tritici ST99CH_3D1]
MGPRDRPGNLNLNDTSFLAARSNAAASSSSTATSPNPSQHPSSSTTSPTRRTGPTSPSRPSTADDFRPPRPHFYMDLPSPRTGEVPPALSPLDAFAMQSRLLAKRFEQDAEGRRISRLPPVMVAKEMSSRPGFFRGLSEGSKMSDLAEDGEEGAMSPDGMDGSGQQRGELHEQGLEEKERPVSHYPLLARASGIPEQMRPKLPTPYFDAEEEQGQRPNADYFDMPRAASPENVDNAGEKVVNVQAPSPNLPSLTHSVETISSHPRTRTNDSQRSQRSMNSDRGGGGGHGLAPPQSPRFPRSPRSFQSIRSVPPDSGDEDVQSGSQPVSSSRKFSGSSNMSRPQSPFSPWMQPVHRSPSMTSEYSITGSQHQMGPLGRPNANFNFSRPLSSHGSRPSVDARPSLENGRPSIDQRATPRRQPSGASTSTHHSSTTHHSSKPALSRSGSGDDVGSNKGWNGGKTPGADRTPGPQNGPSYIYAKSALPRQQRPMEGDSTAFRDSWIQKQFEWDSRQQRQQQQNGASSQQANAHSHDRTQSDVDLPTHGIDSSSRPTRTLAPAPSALRSHSADPRNATHRSTPSVKTASTDRTIKPLHQKSPSANLTPEEHLDIGISCHDAGHTTKSTYHLRLAAHAGLPTAMLLYALACRHGWGMRANQEEGVKWLRKAIDSSSLSVLSAPDSTTTRDGTPLDPTERKNRKAQYALAIYELGNSSMHGWGCAKDKQLALRCYEIAGEWGDADALAEAGRCWTEGVGCRKDVRKGAGFLRRAERGGWRGVGVSWIYKEKYMDGEEVGEGGKAGVGEGKRPKTSEGKKGEVGERRRGDKSHAAKTSTTSTTDSPMLDPSDRPDRTEKEKEKNELTKTRARSRSLWGRAKKDKSSDVGHESPMLSGGGGGREFAKVAGSKVVGGHHPPSAGGGHAAAAGGGGGGGGGGSGMGRDGREAWLANNNLREQIRAREVMREREGREAGGAVSAAAVASAAGSPLLGTGAGSGGVGSAGGGGGGGAGGGGGGGAGGGGGRGNRSPNPGAKAAAAAAWS